jgi:DNA-binding transcriptional ArsR family regulator
MTIPAEPRDLRRLAATFGSLAHPTRLRILEALRHGEAMSPKQLCEQVAPAAGLANVAHHTRRLAARGAVQPAGTRAVRGAVEHFYRLTPAGRELLEVIDRFAGRGEEVDAA